MGNATIWNVCVNLLTMIVKYRLSLLERVDQGLHSGRQPLKVRAKADQLMIMAGRDGRASWAVRIL